MGEVAEMHVAAYEAGLDPAEMDGADWADFFDAEDESDLPPNPWLIWHEVCSFVEWLDREAKVEGGDASDVFAAYFPGVSQRDQVVSALRQIASHPDPEDDQ